MKINYISYLNPLQFSGGGEMIMRSLLEFGETLGHEMRFRCVLGKSDEELFAEPDLYWLVDVYNCPYHWKRFHRRVLSKMPGTKYHGYWETVHDVVQRHRYVHFDNAYVDVCDFGYLPCIGQTDGARCAVRSADRALVGCFKDKTTLMYRNAMLNIFLSPLHRTTVQSIVGVDAVGEYYELKPLVDASKFYDMSIERDTRTFSSGSSARLRDLRTCGGVSPTAISH